MTNQLGTAGSSGTGSAGTTGQAGTSGGAGTTGVAGTGNATAGVSGAAGTGSGAAGTGAAGTGSGTAGTGSGTAGSTGAAGATGAAGTGSGTTVPTGPFDCTLVAGLLVTGEWYNAGFENGGVDGTKWEGKFVHYGYIDVWAQPTGFTWAGAISSACTTKSTTPDRVVYTAWSWELAYMEDKYVEQTALAVKQFIAHYPSMKRMDIMTIVRCPGNETTMVTGQKCNANAAIPPIAGTTDHNAGQQDCFVNPEVDSALNKVAAMFPGLVTVGKKFYSPACRQPVDGAHLGNNNTQVAKDIAAYYKTMP